MSHRVETDEGALGQTGPGDEVRIALGSDPDAHVFTVGGRPCGCEASLRGCQSEHLTAQGAGGTLNRGQAAPLPGKYHPFYQDRCEGGRNHGWGPSVQE